MSGIYIPGMEIPENCGECLFAKLSPTGESLICNYMLSRVSWEERPFDCPLVPVPPHGDLIGHNPLIDIAMHLRNRAKDEYTKRAIGSVIQYIAEAPTIISAEEGEG